ncbi:MAG: Gfo/Idh/MocA family oxidoreductase [Planctomycetes bacterium]|nr:Gfo/Idh/MocA family oxidoreductase [Planctomycetota bacterium]
MARQPLRLGVVGGRRGGSFTVALEHLRKRVRLTAICDLSDEVIGQWKQAHPGIAAFKDFSQMLAADACDAVIIATPMSLHAKQSVAAMRAGKHVLSEVTACVTHAEAMSLVRAVRDTGVTYMMAENYTYMRPHMMVLNMVRKGVFGDLTYAEGMYLHDCRSLVYLPDGTMTWRGDARRDMPSCNCYPTHSLGPVAQWMGINKEDRIATVYSASAPPLAIAAYTRDRFGPKHPGAKPGYWSLGDSNSVIVRTKLGRVIYLRFDANSVRPHHAAVHELQGTSAVFRTQVDVRDEPLVWIDGRSPGGEARGRRKRGNVSYPSAWEKLSKYAADFEHPRWKKHMATALKAGHGGGDFFELEDFIDAIDGRAPSPIDVYDAVAWSSVTWLSEKSEKTGRAERAYDYTAHRG